MRNFGNSFCSWYGLSWILKDKYYLNQKINKGYQTDETVCLRSKTAKQLPQEYKENSRGASSDFPTCLRLCGLRSYQYIWPYGYDISKKFWSVCLEKHITIHGFSFFLWVKKKDLPPFWADVEVTMRRVCDYSYFTVVSASTDYSMITSDICSYLYSLKSLMTCLISLELFNNLYFPFEELRLKEGLEPKIRNTC